MGSSGLEPPTSRLSGGCSNQLSYKPILLQLSARFRSGPLDGGDDGIRTHDPLLAGQVLSQLSYTPSLGVLLFHREPLRIPDDVGVDLSSRTVARKVFSALQSLTSVFGMGTGGPFALKTPTVFQNLLDPEN